MIPEVEAIEAALSADGDRADPNQIVNQAGRSSKQAAFFSFSRASTFQQQLRPPSR
jgi:hypothetical protein